MPSVMVKVKELDSAYNTILNAVEFHLDNWPIKPRMSEANVSLPVNTAFCCDHDDEEEEEDYDDMPPLIPIHEPQQFRTHHIFLD
jgi:hypothetical protein